MRDLSLFATSPSHEREPVDVREAMDAAIAVTSNEIRHRARLRKTYADVRAVEASPSELRQALAHLLLGAAATLPEGSAAQHEVAVLIETNRDGRVQITVSHTGQIDRLPSSEDPLDPRDGAEGRRELGLALCRKVVERLAGTLTHDPRSADRASGSRVVVTLPVHDPSNRRPSSGRMRAARREAMARVLIVDDEPLVRDALCRALAPEIDVVVAGSGGEAIEAILSDQTFDVIVCDLMMPDISGMDVYESIRRARPGLAERFLFMTGGAFTPKAARFVAQLRGAVLEKPISVEVLRDAVLGHASARARR